MEELHLNELPAPPPPHQQTHYIGVLYMRHSQKDQTNSYTNQRHVASQTASKPGHTSNNHLTTYFVTPTGFRYIATTRVAEEL